MWQCYNPILSMNRLRKAFVISILCSLALIFYEYFGYSGLRPNELELLENNLVVMNDHRSNELSSSVQEYFDKRKNWVTSNLGSVLFKNNAQQYHTSKNRTFVILIWKYWNWLKRRHLSGYVGGDVFDSCSVSNCMLTSSDSDLSKADAVVVHVQHGVLPSMGGRHPSQRWVFLSDESPVNSFSMSAKRPNMASWANVFNWSMSYRSDSDVPVPYGRTVPRRNSIASEIITDEIPFWKLKDREVLMAALISHCGVTARMNYIKEMQKYLDVDVYGACSEKNLTCPGHFREDCWVINKYIFYLAFENTKCRQYLTEKIFYNAYAKGAIPIILGAPKEDCENLLPPNSFLHVDNYPNPKALAEHIENIMKDEDLLLKYHEWRWNFELLNEHGYFKTKSYHFCRLCEALNYNDESPKVYSEDDLKMFFEPKLLCNLPEQH